MKLGSQRDERLYAKEEKKNIKETRVRNSHWAELIVRKVAETARLQIQLTAVLTLTARDLCWRG